MENKYYTPQIEEFCIGFEFEYAETFMDGTVKSKEDFDKAKYQKQFFSFTDLPYLERALNGKNAINGYCGIRVKYLDREDIESLKWDHDQTTKDGAYFYIGSIMTDNMWCLTAENAMLKKGNDYTLISIYDINKSSENSFYGIVKNKNELSNIMGMLGIGK